jgi:hypothetical protein
MSRPPDRRALLLLGAGGLALGGGAILGLKLIGRPWIRRLRGARPHWIEAGLQQVRSTGLPGIVVVAPEDDEERLGRALAARLRSPDPEVTRLFTGAVWMCLRAGDAEPIFRPTRRLMRVDATGAVLDSSSAALDVFENDTLFIAAVGRLVGAGQNAAGPAALPFGTEMVSEGGGCGRGLTGYFVNCGMAVAVRKLTFH